MVKPHGLQGEVVVELYAGRPERTRPGTRFTTDRGPLQVVRATPFPGRRPGRWIVWFDQVTGYDDAEALRDLVLLAPPLHDPEALWVHELVGSPVVDRAGRSLGTVEAVVANPASDLLELDNGGLVPLTFVVDHDASGTIVVDVPAGLLP